MAGWLQRRMLRLFKTLSRTSLWFETRFSDVGTLVLAGAIAASIFGVDPRQTFAFQLAAILLAALAVAMLFALRWRPWLEIRRTLPDTVTAEIDTTYRLTITNRGKRTESGLVVVDTLRTRYPDAAAFREPVHPVRETGLNWFDRRVGFPRWLELLRRGRGGRIEALELSPLGPGETVTVNASFRPLRRGKIVFEGVTVKRADPLGLFFALAHYPVYGEIISLPQRYPVPRLRWQSERHFHPGGMMLAATVGDSQEFIGLREYRPGDPLRHIHWRSFARLGEPVVKEYQDEYFDRHALLLDTYGGASGRSAFETAVAVAASLIQSDRPNDSILDLVFIDGKVWRMTAGRGLSNDRQVLTQLAELNANPEDEFDQLANYTRRHLDRLASVVLVCTSWDSARAAFLAELQYRHLHAVVLKVAESRRGEPPATRTDPAIVDIRPNAPAEDLSVLANLAPR